MRVDLNADAGESFGAWVLGDDAALLAHVTSVNIACGFHAGDPSVIRRTIRLAAEAGVRIGAHPGYPNLQGFGRRAMALPARDVEDLVLYQVAALLGIARAEGVRLAHVKPHGALYNQAARDPALASAIARAVASLDPSLVLVGLAGSSMIEAATDAGLPPPLRRSRTAPTWPTARWPLDTWQVPSFTMRLSSPAGRSASSGMATCAASTRIGTVPVRADTLCIHGDTPGAAELARAVRAALEGTGVRVVAPGA